MLYNPLAKKTLKMRKSLEIQKIPNPSYDESYLGYLNSSSNSVEFGKVGSGEEL